MVQGSRIESGVHRNQAFGKQRTARRSVDPKGLALHGALCRSPRFAFQLLFQITTGSAHLRGVRQLVRDNQALGIRRETSHAAGQQDQRGIVRHRDRARPLKKVIDYAAGHDLDSIKISVEDLLELRHPASSGFMPAVPPLAKTNRFSSHKKLSSRALLFVLPSVFHQAVIQPRDLVRSSFALATLHLIVIASWEQQCRPFPSVTTWWAPTRPWRATLVGESRSASNFGKNPPSTARPFFQQSFREIFPRVQVRV